MSADDIHRPRTRGECASVPRPCPFAGCRHHLYLEVSGRNVHIRFPGAPEDMPPDRSCSLDVAEEGGLTLEETGALLGVTREGARKLEIVALQKARKRGGAKLEGFR